MHIIAFKQELPISLLWLTLLIIHNQEYFGFDFDILLEKLS